MNAARDDAEAAYHVGKDGTVRLNDAGLALITQYNGLKAQIEALDRNWCEAVLAALFLRHPWIDALTLVLSSSWEYDDTGGCHLCGYCRVEQVGMAPRATLPKRIPDDTAIPDWAEDLLNEVLDNDASGLALALLGEDQSGDRRLFFTRAALLRKFNLARGEDRVDRSTDQILAS